MKRNNEDYMRKYSKDLYKKEVIFKAAYAFTDEVYVHIDSNEDSYLIELKSKNGIEEDMLYERFENELIAQETRRIVSEKTQSIREMIVARALSSTIVCNPESNTENAEDFNANEILTDWFEGNG